MARATDQSRTGYVTIATVGSRSEARDFVAKLKAAGIESVLSDERASTYPTTALGIGGTKVQVSRTQVERAVRALQLSARLEGGHSDSVYSSNQVQRRQWLDFNSWHGAAIAVAALVAFAVLLAVWLF